MLKFGTVTAINPKIARARVQFADDNVTSFWLAILQKKTYKDKFYFILSVGEQVACLMDENSEEGGILGSIYTSEDIPINESDNEFAVNFEDATYINANKETHTLTLSFPNIHIIGNITHEGTLDNTAGINSESNITSLADVIDKKSSMQDMRDIYNPHTHTGNLGAPTSATSSSM